MITEVTPSNNQLLFQISLLQVRAGAINMKKTNHPSPLLFSVFSRIAVTGR